MSDILSQEEIDALLGFIEADKDINKAKNNNSVFDEKNIIPYDFGKQDILTQGYIKDIQIIHKRMIKNLAIDISSLLNSVVEIKLCSVEEITYKDFLNILPNFTSFNVFSLAPLDGKGIIEISQSVVFPMIDKLLGGAGLPFYTKRKFTDIEVTLLEQILKVIIKDMQDIFSSIVELYPVVELKESSPNSRKIMDKDEKIIKVSMEITMGNIKGKMNICYQVNLVKSIFSKVINRDLLLSEKNKEKSRNKELRALIRGAKMELEAVLGYANLNMEEILDLKKGDIIKLDRAADDTVVVKIDGREKFVGEFGVRRYRRCIKITEKLKTEHDEVKEILEMLEMKRKQKLEQITGEESE